MTWKENRDIYYAISWILTYFHILCIFGFYYIFNNISSYFVIYCILSRYIILYAMSYLIKFYCYKAICMLYNIIFSHNYEHSCECGIHCSFEHIYCYIRMSYKYYNHGVCKSSLKRIRRINNTLYPTIKMSC